MIAGLLPLIAWIVARLPRRALPALGAFFGFLARAVFRYRRSHVVLSMQRAGLEDPARSATALYRQLGVGLAELLWLGGHGGRGASAVLHRDARGALAEAVERGPVVIFASHTGNWELAAAAAAEALRPLGKKLFVVAKTQSVSAVDAFCMRLRRALGVHVIAPKGALREAMKALEAGDVVVLPIDQVPDRASHAMTVQFLGAPALVDRAPATLAHRARATVLVAAAMRGEAGVTVSVLDTIAPGNARVWIEDTTARATKALEAFVRAHPADWLWLHRRWKHLPDARLASLGFSENPG